MIKNAHARSPEFRKPEMRNSSSHFTINADQRESHIRRCHYLSNYRVGA